MRFGRERGRSAQWVPRPYCEGERWLPMYVYVRSWKLESGKEAEAAAMIKAAAQHLSTPI